MAHGKRCSWIVLGIFILISSVLHSSKSQLLDSEEKPDDDRQSIENLNHTNKCVTNDTNSPGSPTVLLAQLLDTGSDTNDTEKLERLVFPVDSSIHDLTVSSTGWTFRLWKINDVVDLQPSDSTPPCLTQVIEAEPVTRFEFQELSDLDNQGREQRPRGDTGCREFTADTCVARTQLGDGQWSNGQGGGPWSAGDDDGDGTSLKSEESCPDYLHIPEPGKGLRYLELFRDPDVETAEVTVTGESYLHFHFNFSNPIAGKPIFDQPIAGDAYGIELTFRCPDQADLTQSRLVTYSESGRVLELGDPLQEGANGITIAHENFYIGVEGVDVHGEKFVRISPDLVKPRMFVLSFATPAHIEELHPKQNLDVRIRLRNQDKRDTFSVKASFSKYRDYLTAKITPNVLDVKRKGYGEIHIVVGVHESISQKISSRLTIEVMRHSDKSLTSITRDVTATPDSFGEDADPPSCSTIYESSQCDPMVNCSENTWEAGVLVDDLSGVYRAAFSKPLMSSIAYLQAHGKLQAQALVRRNCCAQNATLLVEDYMGNHQTCTLQAPNFTLKAVGQRATLSTGRDAGSGENPTTKTGQTKAIENTTQTPLEEVTKITDTARNTDHVDQEEDGFWTPQLLAKLKILAILLTCVVLLLLLICIVQMVHTKETRGNKTKRASSSPAFHLHRIGSSRRANPDQTRSENVQMANLEQSAASGLPTGHMKVRGVVEDKQLASQINLAFHLNPEKNCAAQETELSNQTVKPDQDGGGGSGTAGASDVSASLASLASSRGDDAYSSLRSSTKGRGSQNQTPKEMSVSQLNISDLEPKNKTEMYERIIQCRHLLEQLEKKRADLMNCDNFKHHTVPRIKQNVRHPEPHWDVENNPEKHGETGDGKGDNSETDTSHRFGEHREADDQTMTDSDEGRTSADDTQRAISSPASPAICRENLSSLSEGNQSTQAHRRIQPQAKKDICDVTGQQHGGGTAREIRNAGTPPELSQGHVRNLIEGATQISLRHEIQRLRERLLEYSKDVEDEIHFKKDLYERLSLAGEQEDSDYEEN